MDTGRCRLVHDWLLARRLALGEASHVALTVADILLVIVGSVSGIFRVITAPSNPLESPETQTLYLSAGTLARWDGRFGVLDAVLGQFLPRGMAAPAAGAAPVAESGFCDSLHAGDLFVGTPAMAALAREPSNAQRQQITTATRVMTTSCCKAVLSAACPASTLRLLGMLRMSWLDIVGAQRSQMHLKHQTRLSL